MSLCALIHTKVFPLYLELKRDCEIGLRFSFQHRNAKDFMTVRYMTVIKRVIMEYLYQELWPQFYGPQIDNKPSGKNLIRLLYIVL